MRRRLFVRPVVCRARPVLLASCLLLGLSACSLSGGSSADAPRKRPPANGMTIRVTTLTTAPTSAPGEARVTVTARLTNVGQDAEPLRPSDVSLLAASGISYAPSGVSDPPSALSGPLAPGATRDVRLAFQLPSAAVPRGCLFYHSGGGESVCARLDASATTTITQHPLDEGGGYPWGMVADDAGNLWFAEPGCDFPLGCAASTPPGHIGVWLAASGRVVSYPLPDLPGNQPLFLALGPGGAIWFTTPNNSMIGAFNPQTRQVIGQWPVIPDSGPWALAFSGNTLWYTENFISGIGAFDIATHTFHDVATPSPNSSPYGIAASGDHIWFTENSSAVARIGMLDSSAGHTIVEYPIHAGSATNLTPHLIAVDAHGHPWWTEGSTRAIATLDPAAATPGRCSVAAGDCPGIREFALPPAPSSCPNAHASAIAIGPDGTLWLTDSLAGQVGSFNPATRQFTLYPLDDCNAHAHDGLALDGDGHVWWTEEFAGQVGELRQD